MSDFQLGDEVSYRQGDVTHSGVVNGKPISDEAGFVTHVPVWSKTTDNTVYVAVSNIVSQDPPTKGRICA